jgi:sugar phosphate isomerase/epimerase
MKLSVTTFPWRKIQTPRELSNILATIRNMGFQGVGLEYGYLPDTLKKSPELLAPLVSRSGLENGGTFSPGAMTRIQWAKNSKTPLIWVSIYARTRSDALRKLKKFADTAKENGVIASLHNEIRSSFQTTSEIKQAMSSIEDLTLCLDTAHGTAAGVNILEAIEEYADRLTLVHLKDLRAKVPLAKVKFKRDFVNIGRGIVDIKSAIEKLKGIGYNGQLMLEVEANQRQAPGDVVREGYEYIRAIL